MSERVSTDRNERTSDQTARVSSRFSANHRSAQGWHITFTFLYLLATIHSGRYKGWFRVANNQPQFESHHWIRLRTPETELGVFYGDLGTFPAVFLATKSFFFFFPWSRTVSIRVRGNRSKFLATLKRKVGNLQPQLLVSSFEELNCPLTSRCCCNNNLNIL